MRERDRERFITSIPLVITTIILDDEIEKSLNEELSNFEERAFFIFLVHEFSWWSWTDVGANPLLQFSLEGLRLHSTSHVTGQIVPKAGAPVAEAAS